MAAAPVAFALSPALAIPGVIDFASRMGKDVFRFATEKLDEELYDCLPDGMTQFLQSLQVRALEYGWDNEVNGIMQIPDDPADPYSETNDLIESYGMLTLESVRAFEASYIALQVRPAQDTYMLYKCLMKSISKEGKSKITIWKDQYHVNGLPSGNLLLKVIIRESHLDTNATISTIRTKLSNLDTYMLTIGGDITKFNTYVKGLVESLNARGEITTDLLINLFKGYLAVEDKSFHSYVARKQEEYEEGGSQTEDSLMLLAKNKFTLLKDAGRYNMPSAEEEKILALQAELKQVSKRWNKEKKGKSGEPVAKKKGEWTDKNKDTKKKAEKPTWMSEKPKGENLRKSRSYNGKDWWYCSAETGGKCDGNWRVHKPSKCEGRAHKFVGEKHQNDEAKDKTSSKDKKLKLAHAISAIQEDSDDEPSSGEESK
jgi:hypothetical protein